MKRVSGLVSLFSWETSKADIQSATLLVFASSDSPSFLQSSAPCGGSVSFGRVERRSRLLFVVVHFYDASLEPWRFAKALYST